MKHNFMFTLILITLVLVACGSPVPDSDSDSEPELTHELLIYSHSDSNGAYLNDKDGNIVFVDTTYYNFDFVYMQPDTLFVGTFDQHELTDLKLKEMEEN